MINEWRRSDQVHFHVSVIVAESARLGKGITLHPNVVIGEEVVIEDGVTVFSGTVVGRPPMVAGIVPIKEYRPTTVIGMGSVIGSNATIYAGVDIGPDVLIGDGVRIRENTTIGTRSVIGSNSTVQNDVVVGKRVRVVDLSHLTAGTTIDDDVFWSVGVLSMNDNRDGRGLTKLHIGEGAFIGGGAILLPGHDIGAHAVVAAGAVVTHPVQEGARVQGVPARQVHDLAYDGTPGPREA